MNAVYLVYVKDSNQVYMFTRYLDAKTNPKQFPRFSSMNIQATSLFPPRALAHFHAKFRQKRLFHVTFSSSWLLFPIFRRFPFKKMNPPTTMDSNT